MNTQFFFEAKTSGRIPEIYSIWGIADCNVIALVGYQSNLKIYCLFTTTIEFDINNGRIIYLSSSTGKIALHLSSNYSLLAHRIEVGKLIHWQEQQKAATNSKSVQVNEIKQKLIVSKHKNKKEIGLFDILKEKTSEVQRMNHLLKSAKAAAEYSQHQLEESQSSHQLSKYQQEAENKFHNHQLESATETIKVLKTKHQDQLAQIQSRLDAETMRVETISNSKKVVERELEDTKQRLNITLKSLDSTKSDLEVAKNQIKHLRKELEQAREPTKLSVELEKEKQEYIEQVLANLDMEKQRANSNYEDKRDVEKQLNSTQTQLEDTKNQLQFIQNELEQYKSDIVQMQTDLNLEKERTEMAANSIEIMLELKQQLRDKTKLLESTHAEILVMQSDLTETKQRNVHLEKKHKAQIDQIQSALQPKRAATVNKEEEETIEESLQRALGSTNNPILEETIQLETNNQDELASTKQQLLISQQELEKTKHCLSSSQQDFNFLKLTLQSTQTLLYETQHQLATTKQQTKQAKQIKQSTKEQLDHQRLLVQLEAVRKELELVHEAYNILEHNYQLEKEEHQEQIAKLMAQQSNVTRDIPTEDNTPVVTKSFTDLRDKDLVNLVVNLTDDAEIQHAVFPLIYQFAFPNFWSTICDNDSQEFKMRVSKTILESEEAIKKHAERLTDATMEAIAEHQSPPPFPPGSYSLFLSFFSSCTRWNASIIQCNPMLEVTPKNQLPNT